MNQTVYIVCLALGGITVVLLVLGAAWGLTRWPIEDDRDRRRR